MSGRRQGRELTFIVDVSGSMAGASIRQARAALIAALDTLTPQDRFNIIAFNSSFRSLFQDTVPADGKALLTARQWIDALKAEGGTDMASPIRAALSAPGFLRSSSRRRRRRGRHPGPCVFPSIRGCPRGNIRAPSAGTAMGFKYHIARRAPNGGGSVSARIGARMPDIQVYSIFRTFGFG